MSLDTGPVVAAAPVSGAGTGGVVARRRLFERLDRAPRVMVVPAPAGSGKTMLLRSWISEEGLAERAGWVAAGQDERDPQQFWLAVVSALRQTVPGLMLVQPLTAAPDLDGWTVVERLLAGLAPLGERVWLVVDDVHELGPEALRQLELLIMRAPAGLRFVLAARHDVQLGLHRLRLEGELAEIREPDLRFSVAEAGELFAVAGVELSEPVVAVLRKRTEGWAAGLRLAALSLAGHPDPEGWAAGFSGSERTVAEYLLAEVLDRQDEPVRELLLRTSVLERVNGELADLLTGGQGGERMLQDLEAAGAFVISVDPSRSWFRYHRLLVGLLQLELRRAAPGEVAGLHRAASGWFAAQGYPVEAVRHAQAAGDWELAARLLTGHWPGLYLDGQAAAVGELLSEFPAEVVTADAELAALIAGDELAHGSLEAAEQYLSLAERDLAAVPGARQGEARLLLGIVRPLLARQRGNLLVEAQEAQRLELMAQEPDAASPATGKELRALALISLGYANGWTARPDQSRTGHLERGIALARQAGRPYLEFTGLAYQAAVEAFWSLPGAAEHGGRAIALAELHGWTGVTANGVACVALGGALAAFRAVERLCGQLPGPHPFARPVRAWLLHALVRLGETDLAEEVLEGLGGRERERGAIRIADAMLRLARDEPLAALAPVLDGSARVAWRTWLIQALLLEAAAHDALGDDNAAEGAVERALDCAEADGAVLWFLLHPPGLLERHARHRNSHAALSTGIQSLLAVNTSAPWAGPRPPLDPLSDSELRVLRYLPTSLTGPEIAAELRVSPNTVKTHMRSMYAKLGTHHRTETVIRARELGLLAPSVRGIRR
jgi:LuxR family maltose regulon positive regulatory protein